MDSNHYDPQQLKAAREAANLTQAEAGKRLGVHEMTISRADCGAGVSFDLLKEYCALVKLDISYLLTTQAKAA